MPETTLTIPFSIGDAVYQISPSLERIHRRIITMILITPDGPEPIFEMSGVMREYFCGRYARTVFVDRLDAIAAMQKMQQEAVMLLADVVHFSDSDAEALRLMAQEPGRTYVPEKREGGSPE